MKIGWQTKPLRDVCEIKPQKAEARARLGPDAQVSFVPMEDLGIDQKYFVASQQKPLGSVVGSYTYFSDGDVLLAKITPCFENGKLGIAAKLQNGTGFGSSEFIVFRPSAGLDSGFLYYFLSRSEFREEGAERMGGAVGHQRVPKEFIENYRIPTPCVCEQRRIVGILDGAFEGIAIARANAEKNFQNARALFASHLAAVFNRREVGWADTTLGAVCELFQGLCINAKTKHLLVESSSLPLLRIKDLRTNSAELYVAESGWPKKARVSESDIIYTRTGQIGLVFRGRSGILHNNCFKVEPQLGLDRAYLFWWLQNPVFRSRITGLASKAAQPDITHPLFKVQPIVVPPREYQELTVAQIEEAYECINQLAFIYERKLAELDRLKESLLHEAFTGQL